MRILGKSRSASLAGRICLLVLLFAGVVQAAPDGIDQLLRQADEIKTADNSRFLEIVHRLDEQSAQFSRQQRAWLDYLKGWQLGYSGEYEAAVPALKAVIAAASDPVLRFRASITLINSQALASHYEEAYARLSELLEEQPQIPDKTARMLAFAVASLLYNEAGQYDLALNYSERWLAEESDDAGVCKATYQKLDALFRSQRLDPNDAAVRHGIDACTRVGEPLFANLIRTFVANVQIAQGHAAEAIELLQMHDAEVQQSHSARVMSEFHSILARAYLLTGDRTRARQYATSAIDKSIKKQASKPLADAYNVLYKVAQAEGDFQSALAYHEKFSEADRGYLTDTTARTLAFQMVNQQVLDKKRQIDVLNEKNQVLRLNSEVASRAAESSRLYVALLIFGLASIGLWAWRTKRSQVRFQKLSRRDGLTGIVNRQHFMDEAKALLRFGARNGRDVCLLLIDLDNFKTVNDTHGHAAGDAVLRQTVATCQGFMRPVDLFGRLGGEEFGVMLPDCSLDAARQRAEELRAALAANIAPDLDFPVSASFGVASARDSGYDLRQMLIQADSALYRAKRAGRNRVECAAAGAAEAQVA